MAGKKAKTIDARLVYIIKSMSMHAYRRGLTRR